MREKYETVRKVLEALLEELERWKERHGKLEYFRVKTSDLLRTKKDDLFEWEVKKKTIYHILKMLERAGYLEKQGKKWYLSERIIKLLS